MIDSFWLAIGSGCVVLVVNGIFGLMWWSIRQNIANITSGLAALGGTVATLQTNIDTKISELQRENAKDQKEMEARFMAAIRESDNRFYAYSARVSEVSEGLLKMQVDFHKDFVRAGDFREIFNDFRKDIKGSVEKLEHQIEKVDEKLDRSLQGKTA